MSRFRYSSDMLTFLKLVYQKCEITQLTDKFNQKFNLNKTKQEIRAALRNHKITCNRSGQFSKGNVPFNAGKVGLPVHPNSIKTQFKKGQTPKYCKPLGHERICSKDGFVLVKVAEKNPHTGHKTRFRAKQLVVWEQHNGPIPKGHIVRFLDGDKKNVEIENLTLISKALHLHLNRHGYANITDELKPSLMALCKLEVAYFAKQKELSEGAS